jgi:hypothetical protein
MRTYTIEVVIREDSSKFWEEFNTESVSGCDDILQLVKDNLGDIGFIVGDNCDVNLNKFEDI